MTFEFASIDDLLNGTLSELVALPFDGEPSRSKELGKTSEIIGGTLKLTNPLSRLSLTESRSTLFSALGEFLWYLSGNNEVDHVSYYISKYSEEQEDGRIWGGYGPRLFNLNNKHNQIKNIINILTRKPFSRRAVVQIFDGEDLLCNSEGEDHKDIPCTCTMQFFVRYNKLQMVVYMRSNDAYLGLPHDVFAFTLLQEIVARSLNIEMGTYSHLYGSLHLYEGHKTSVDGFLQEGLQSTTVHMPSMPLGDPWESVKILISAEADIREGRSPSDKTEDLHEYWKDIITLLKIFRIYKNRALSENDSWIDDIHITSSELNHEFYKEYVRCRFNKASIKSNKSF